MKSLSVVKIGGLIVALLGVVAFIMGYFITENIKEVSVGNLFITIGLVIYLIAKIKD